MQGRRRNGDRPGNRNRRTRARGRSRVRNRNKRMDRRQRQNRGRLLLPAVLAAAALALLLLAAGITAAVRFSTRGSSSENDETMPQAKNLTIETDTGTEEGTGDNRRVKNTATEENHKTNGLAICMYHYVYDASEPPDDLNSNYIEVHDLEEEVKYLVDHDYYFPTWEEVRQYVDGELLLPEKSVVLTFDDGAKSFLELGIPVFEKYEVPATSFLITGSGGEEKVAQYQSDYVTFQSHSDNMHRGGGNIGHGGIFTAMSHDDAVADLEKSIEICGHGDAFAYPYGDYTDDCRQAVEDAGFLCAVTTENRRAEVGDDPLLLPRVRMLQGQTLEGFISLIE